MRMRHPSPFKRRRQLVLVALGEFWCLWLHCHRWVRGCRIGGPGSVIGGWHLTVPSTVSQHSAVRASLADSYMYRVLSLRRGRLHDAMSAALLTGGLFARGCVAVRDGRANGEPGGRHVLENPGWARISISQARLAGSPNPHHEVESQRVFSSSAYGILSRPNAFENPACFFLPMIKHQHFIGNPSISRSSRKIGQNSDAKFSVGVIIRPAQWLLFLYHVQNPW